MSTGRILVVDDEPQIRRVLRTTISAQGYEVFDAKSGEEALLTIREQRFDLVLLDVNMPGMGGLAACREIRAGSDMAIIMLTVRNSEQDKVTALDAGADDYITKPFGIPELSARIRAALRRLPITPLDSDKQIRLEGVAIDLQMRRVRKADKEIRLTPKEYDLLRLLVQHAGKVLTHRQLLQEVWGPGHVERSHYVRLYVGYLRRKLGADPARPAHLVTETGVGYRFVL